MAKFLDIPVELRLRIFKYLLPQGIHLHIRNPIRVKHSLFHVSRQVHNEAIDALAQSSKCYIWVYDSEEADDPPKLELPAPDYLSNVTCLNIIVRSAKVEETANRLGSSRLHFHGARLANWLRKFESLKELSIGIPYSGEIDEDLMMHFLQHLRTKANIKLDERRLSKTGRRMLEEAINDGGD
ncbi:MAG: hypothetical protein M1820_006867 [Bogoriella megaspora]|nr:MAG: hypothetical protein M1820_006867 [Bogoriella megaspora]